MSAEQGERCQLCGSLVEVVFSDEGTSCYRPASAEQGDVQPKESRVTAEFMVLESEREKLEKLISYAKRLGIAHPHIESFDPKDANEHTSGWR